MGQRRAWRQHRKLRRAGAKKASAMESGKSRGDNFGPGLSFEYPSAQFIGSAPASDSVWHKVDMTVDLKWRPNAAIWTVF